MKKYLLGLLTVALAAGLSVFSFSCGGDGGTGKCQTAIDSGIVADIIANCDSTKLSAQENRDAGLKLIAMNSGSDAKVFLSAVPSTDPLYGEAQYGIMITDLQSLTKDVDSLIGMVMSLTSMTSWEAQQSSGVDLWSMLGSMIDPIKTKLIALDTEAAAVIANGYTVSTDPLIFTKVPLVLGTSGGQYYIKVDVKGKADPTEARALRIVANLVVGVIEFIAAHDLTIDLTSAMNNLSSLMDLLSGLTGGGSSSVDVVKALRGLGWLIADNPKLLTQSSTRWSSNMGDVPVRFTAAIDSLRELDADIISVRETTADACKAHVACLVSSDAAINTGDQLLINAVVHVEIKMTISTDILNTLNSLAPAISSMFGITLAATATGATVDLDLTNAAILSLSPVLMDPLGRIITPLDALLVKAKSSINDGVAITTADINPVLVALDPTLPTIHDGLVTITVDKLYEKPLRNLMFSFPCGADTMPGTGGSCLAIEVEGTDCTGSSACSIGDGAHFAGMTGITQIGADGIAPKACTLLSTNKAPLVPTKGTIYVALGDASINGVLSIDLSKLPAAVQTAEDANHPTADNYSLWKCVNYVITSWAGQAEESTISKQVRGIGDVIINAVPAGTVPTFLDCGAF